MGVVAVGDKYLTTTFRLAGVRGVPVKDEKEAIIKIKELISDEKCDAIIVTETLAKKISKIRREVVRAGKVRPVFIVVPGFEGPLKERIKEIYQLVNQAVGVKLKFGE